MFSTKRRERKELRKEERGWISYKLSTNDHTHAQKIGLIKGAQQGANISHTYYKSSADILNWFAHSIFGLVELLVRRSAGEPAIILKNITPSSMNPGPHEP